MRWLLFLGLLGGTLAAPVFGSSSITGTVTGPDGEPLESISVHALMWNGEWSEELLLTLTDADGRYALTDLEPGTYHLAFDDGEGNYVRQYYPGVRFVYEGEAVVLEPDATVTDIDAQLDEAGHIAGTVTDPDGTEPLAAMSVTAHRFNGTWWELWDSTRTDADGSYDLGGLLPGDYHLEFRDEDTGTYATEWYYDQVTEDLAEPITVEALNTVSGIDASLGYAARISGTVTGPAGSALEDGVSIEAFYPVYYDWGEVWTAVAWADADSNGAYAMEGLPVGSYRIRFRGWSRMYATEWYDDRTREEDADYIYAEEGLNIDGIDAELATASTISGLVTAEDGLTPLAGVTVTALMQDGSVWQAKDRETTSAAGTFFLDGLPQGVYLLHFEDASGRYVSEWYDNMESVLDATSFLVGVSTNVTGIHAMLAEGASLEGTVTGPDGAAPLAGIAVTAYRKTGNTLRYAVASSTMADGHYRIGGIPAGTCVLKFVDGTGRHVTEWYDNVASSDLATPITVAAAETRSGLDASLAKIPQGGIAGSVTRESDGLPLSGVRASIYPWGDTNVVAIASGLTIYDGGYAVSGLLPGQYHVLFDRVGYVSEWYDDAGSLATATPVEVIEDQVTDGIDAALAAPSVGGIAGTVTTTGGQVPLQGITVLAHGWNGADWAVEGSVDTGDGGAYQIEDLEPGTYRVEFSDGLGRYAGQFYDGAATIESADSVFVSGGFVILGVDADLSAVAPPPLARITQLMRATSNQWDIHFTAGVGHSYMLQRADSLTDTWHDVGVPIACGAETNAAPCTNAASRSFWRLRELP